MTRRVKKCQAAQSVKTKTVEKIDLLEANRDIAVRVAVIGTQ
jgi:hypothetical protein